MDSSFDYIIAGQGLAGTLLAFFIEQAGKKVLVVDPGDPVSASRIAAGIINPVTGRRIVKSWKADELIPFAEKTYETLAEKFSRTFYHAKPILEIFTSVKHKNDWLSRTTEPGMELYTNGEMEPMTVQGVNMPLGGIVIGRSGYLQIDELLKCFRISLEKKNCFINEKIECSELILEPGKVIWKNFTVKKIIFCDGPSGQKNPFFSWLPFIPSKGEILSVSVPALPETYILNKSLYLLPVGNSMFRVGATNEWDELDHIPTVAAREKMVRLLNGIITVPYEITAQQAAVRPTVKDRRPFLGSHPQHSQLQIFNGLGTKGVMLAPYFAKQMCDYLVEEKATDPEVNISRFSGS